MGSANCAEAGPGKTKPSASAATMNQEAVDWLGLTWREICHLVILCVSLFYRLKRKSAAHRIIKLGKTCAARCQIWTQPVPFISNLCHTLRRLRISSPPSVAFVLYKVVYSLEFRSRTPVSHPTSIQQEKWPRPTSCHNAEMSRFATFLVLGCLSLP